MRQAYVDSFKGLTLCKEGTWARNFLSNKRKDVDEGIL